MKIKYNMMVKFVVVCLKTFIKKTCPHFNFLLENKWQQQQHIFPLKLQKNAQNIFLGTTHPSTQRNSCRHSILHFLTCDSNKGPNTCTTSWDNQYNKWTQNGQTTMQKNAF
jgi:hypothetical protein